MVTPSPGWCPECGDRMYGPFMSGEIVCDDPDCAYIMWEETTETEEN